MLEENLKSGTASPAEVALSVISFIEVDFSAGSASAEARFFQIFQLLCNRVFGPISTKDFKHEGIGWLARTAKWERPSTSLSPPPSRVINVHSPLNSSSSASRQTSIKTDPVIKLLGAPPSRIRDAQRPLTLVEALAKEAAHRPNVRYRFPFPGLPKSVRDDWIAIIETAILGAPRPGTRPPSHNSVCLMGHLFRVGPVDQTELIRHMQYHDQAKANGQQRPLPFSPFSGNAPSSPFATVAPPANPKATDAPPQVQLSMLEYFLLEFLRYPLYPPEVKANANTRYQTGPNGVLRAVGRTKPYGEQIYEELFNGYAKYYIPIRAPRGAYTGYESVQRPDELFTRLIVSLWLEGQNRLSSTEAATVTFRQRRGEMVRVDLDASYELVQGKYRSLPRTIIRCLRTVINRAVTDGPLLDETKDVVNGFRNTNPDKLCLSPCMTMLQLPFYNYVRTILRYESVHSTTTQSTTFYDALDMWLVWLEPWNTKWGAGKNETTKRIMNTVSRSATGKVSSYPLSTRPKPKSKSVYQPHWEAYIASNLHMYTVPLAIFLRRARELDFSPRLYHKSMETVWKVLRVYSPEVVAVINRLLSSPSPETPTQFSELVRTHEGNLDPFAPPVDAVLSLSSCQADMQILLEEINLQYLKKMEDLDFLKRALASLFGLASETGEENELRALIQKAKVVVGWPQDYQAVPPAHTMPRAKTGSSAASSTSTSNRTEQGEFSDVGRDLVLQGQVKCQAEDTEEYFDRLHARPQSYEIEFLVDLTVKLSDLLNDRYWKLLDDSGRTFKWILPKRINLRFLADYRNILFMMVLAWLWRCIF